MSSFVTPIIDKYRAKFEELASELEAEVETRKANVLREFEGLVVRARASGATQKAAKSAASATGQKRSPEALALKVEEVFTLIQRHPGLRIERLAEIAGWTTKEMVLPLKKLRASKRIVTHGEKRATTYSAKQGK